MHLFRELDAVTLDAFGTLVELDDPVSRLREALARHRVDRSDEEVERGFHAEVDYYVPRSHEGRDDESLRDLRARCAGVFLEGAGADLDPAAFADDFVGALRFVPVAGAVDAVRALRRRGLALAVVSNWDIGLAEHLPAAGLDGFGAIVTSAEAGAPKPDPRLWTLALERLGVEPGRALHVGDRDDDAAGAAAAGMRFELAPLAEAVGRWR